MPAEAKPCPLPGTDGTGRPRRRRSPNPAEIAAACERIRAGWSDKERRKRAGEPEGVALPVVPRSLFDE